METEDGMDDWQDILTKNEKVCNNIYLRILYISTRKNIYTVFNILIFTIIK